ncbi:hypothetical protein BK816_00630 [Boudabousia tangfeifanii]|uniref:Type II secretion system protein GspF domain-containing protein n=1 Tax=Boudabousia tangfeifanii TaxID=1912795 RepID=A0A1D9MI38_9ACTO|nr:hypothetical protein [Boudabousia tangfeifanii]AOZ71981.1 hypothetical protein BK816_00630 [Boudabousia tangfeifanii]
MQRMKLTKTKRGEKKTGGLSPDLLAWASLLREVSAGVASGQNLEEQWCQSMQNRGIQTSDLAIVDLTDFAPTLQQWLQSWDPKAGEKAAFRATIATQKLASLWGMDPTKSFALVATALERAQAIQNARDAALAGPKATVQLLGFLPFAGLIAGEVVGLSPLTVLFGSFLGWVALVLGTIAWLLGWGWSRLLWHRAIAVGDSALAVPWPVQCVLLAQGLQTAGSLPQVLVEVASACEHDDLVSFGQKLVLESFWQVDTPSRYKTKPTSAKGAGRWRLFPRKESQIFDFQVREELFGVLEKTWLIGADPSEQLIHFGSSVALKQEQYARKAAEELAIKLTLPLGLCFLPAFIAWSIFPAILTLFHS